MDITKKISLALEYLMMGGEIEMKGKTYVWLKNKVVRETETHQYVIDGLAIKGRSYNGSDDEIGEECYMGQKHIPLEQFIELINSIPERTFEEIVMNMVLTKSRQKER